MILFNLLINNSVVPVLLARQVAMRVKNRQLSKYHEDRITQNVSWQTGEKFSLTSVYPFWDNRNGKNSYITNY